MNTILNIVLTVTLTCYNPVVGQCDDDPLVTATGAVIESPAEAHKHRYIALSRDLLDIFPYHSEIIVSGCSIDEYNGVWYVEDTMNKRYTNFADLCVGEGMPLTKELVTITTRDEAPACALYCPSHLDWMPIINIYQEI